MNHGLANSRRLEIFVHVVDLQSFSRAGERLFLTQPAISTQIKMLERVVGRPLFDRRKRSLVLTEAGEALYAYARRFFTLAEEMESGIANTSGLVLGRAEVGATEPWVNELTPLLVDFHQAHPQAFLTVRFGSASYVLESIVENHLGLGFVNQNPRDPRLETTRVSEHEMRLCLFAAPSHPVAGSKQADPHVLESYPFVHYPRQQPGYVDDYFEQLGVRPQYVMELDSTDAIRVAVERGVGLTLLTDDAAFDPKRLVRIPLAAPAYKLQLFAVRNKHRNPSVVERALLDFVISRFAPAQ